MKKALLSMLFGLLIASSVPAQQRTVSGRVISEEEPDGLIGVNVLVKGTTTGVVTDLDGNYTVQVPDGATTLVFSYIGYLSKEEVIGNRSQINVTLNPDAQNLAEIVITAYGGTVDKGNFTGSAVSLKGDKIADRPINNIINAIEGQAPGVITTSASGQPGATPAVRIRGVGSVNSSSSPLYVVDGVPYDGDLSNLNPSDIADMTILKDASSSALFGARAANGVVMITTKTGKKNEPTFNLKIQQGFSGRALPEYDRVNAAQYYPLVWESLKNGRIGMGRPADEAAQYASTRLIRVLRYNNYNVPDDQIVGLDGTLNPNAVNNFEGLDWFDELQRTGERKEYNMTYSGGSDKTDFYASVNYLNEQGFIINSDIERFTGRVNVNTQAAKWLKTGLNLAATLSEGNNSRTSGSTNYVNPFFFARNIGPIYPVYAQNMQTGGFITDMNGEKIFDTGNLTELGLPSRGSDASAGRHAVQETLLNVDSFDRDVISGRAYVEAKFLRDFTFRTNISTDMTSLLEFGYDNQIVGDGAPAGRTSRKNIRTNSLTFNQLLSYSKMFEGKHFVEALVGHENYDFREDRQYLAKQDQIISGNIEPDNFVTTTSGTGRVDLDRIESYFSRVNYVYDDKYSISASFRRDGSSRFERDVRWGNFFSVGGAWSIDQERFFSSNFMQLLKLRASYGQVGNHDVSGYYPSQALYDLGKNNAAEPGVLQASLAARDLVWESNNTFDIGVDFAFGNRFQGTLEYFNRVSENLLFEVPLSLTTGLEDRFQNIGTMGNQGIEFSISGDVVQSGEFRWNVGVNVSTFKNEFKKLPFEEQIERTKKYEVGSSIYDFWLRDWVGVDPETGDGLFRADEFVEDDEDIRIVGSDTLTIDQGNARFHYAGSAIPDFFGGLTNTFTYKAFSISVLMSFSVGGDIYDGVYRGLMDAATEGGHYTPIS